MEFDFEQNTTVDSLEKVPAEFQSVYQKGDAGYVINPAFSGLITAFSGMSKTVKATRDENKGWKQKYGTVDLTPLAAYGATTTEIAENFGKKIDEIRSELSQGGKLNIDKVKDELTKGFQTELGKKDAAVKKMEASLNKYLVNAAATAAIAGHKGVPELLLPHIQQQVRVVPDGDDYRVVVVDKDGDARISSLTGKEMTIEDLVKEMKGSAVFGRAFESETKSGGGTSPGATGQGSKQARQQQANDADLSPTERIKRGLAARAAGR